MSTRVLCATPGDPAVLSSVEVRPVVLDPDVSPDGAGEAGSAFAGSASSAEAAKAPVEPLEPEALPVVSVGGGAAGTAKRR